MAGGIFCCDDLVRLCRCGIDFKDEKLASEEGNEDENGERGSGIYKNNCRGEYAGRTLILSFLDEFQITKMEGARKHLPQHIQLRCRKERARRIRMQQGQCIALKGRSKLDRSDLPTWLVISVATMQ